MTPKKGDCSTLHCPVIQQDLSMRAEKGKWEELLLCHRKYFLVMKAGEYFRVRLRMTRL